MTNSNLSLVPDHFFRKATLKNSERFGTAELAKIEGEMFEAREKSSTLEYDIFMRVREQVERYIDRLQSLAKGYCDSRCASESSCCSRDQSLCSSCVQ